MENPIKIDDLGRKTHYFWKHPYQAVPKKNGSLEQWLEKLLPKTNIGPENRPRATKGKDRLPTIHFRVLC